MEILIKKTKNEKIFNSYLAGLYEGDGHIWMPNLTAKKKHNPRFCITFSLKNLELAKKLLELIGYGFIRYKPKDNTCVLTISSVKGLKIIVSSINGELKTPKISQLHKLIDWLNKNHMANIIKLPLNNKDIKKDSWLAGFIDADGSFGVQHTKLKNNNKKRKISCKLRIEQRMYDPVSKNTYEFVLQNICEFLGCNLKTRKQVSTGNEYYIIAASSKNSLIIIKNYFQAFPLFSSKYLDYKSWEKAVDLILKKTHYTDKGIMEIEKIKNNMNSKRNDFNWDHLNNLRNV